MCKRNIIEDEKWKIMEYCRFWRERQKCLDSWALITVISRYVFGQFRKLVLSESPALSGVFSEVMIKLGCNWKKKNRGFLRVLKSLKINYSGRRIKIMLWRAEHLSDEFWVREKENGEETVISYGSCVTRKELLALHEYVTHFKSIHNLFIFRTDHRALVFMDTTEKPISP